MPTPFDFKAFRDAVQKIIYKIIDPVVMWLSRCGVTPNMVTVAGLVGNIAAAILICMSVHSTEAEISGHCRWELVLLGGLLIVVFSLLDMVDGRLSRLGGMSTRFGAMLDTVTDRYSEVVTLGALAWVLVSVGCLWGALMAFLAVLGSMMVSYIRAYGLGFGLNCKSGFMQRPERVVVTSVGCMAAGLAESALVLAIVMVLMALTTNITALSRLSYFYKNLKD